MANSRFSGYGFANLILFYFLLALTILVWTGKIAFGHGLGDLFYAMILTLVMGVHAYLTKYGLKKGEAKNQSKFHQKLFFMVSFITLLFIYKFTFGRGIEYRWNGQIFYSN
jgi:hypothetical protein